MPGSTHRVRKVAATLAAVQTAVVLLASRAAAAPTPTPAPSGDNTCGLLSGEAKRICESDSGDSPNPGTAPSVADTLDPLASLAKGCAKAASWTIDKLSDAVQNTATVDFTNTTFLQQYAVVFAASTILTLLLWLLAVAKRAVRGVPSARPSARRSASSG